MKRKIAGFLFAPFFVGSPVKRAVAASVGLMLAGVSPEGWGIWLLLALAWLFGLNLLALAVGFGTWMLLPFLEWVSLKAGFDGFVPDDPLGNAFVGVLMAALFFPVFLLLFKDRSQRQEPDVRRFVFQDGGRRWRFLTRCAAILLTISLMSLTVFVDGLRLDAVVPDVSVDHDVRIVPVTEKLNRSEREPAGLRRLFSKDAGFSDAEKPEAYGFYAPWDPRGFVELKEGGVIRNLDVLIPQWYSIGDDFLPEIRKQPEVDQLAKKHGVRILPLVHNVRDGQWDGQWLHRLLSSPERREAFIQALLADVKESGYHGINVDFDAVLPTDRNLLTKFMRELSEAFRSEGLLVTQDVPADDPAFNYRELGKSVDKLVVMLYEENFADGKPGPLASLDWVRKTLETMPVPKEKLVVSLGNYGYDWTIGSEEPAEPLTFHEIMKLVDRHGLRIFWDSVSHTPYVRYKKNGEEHVIWFLDGATFHNQMTAAVQAGVSGVALWRVGAEDLSVWNIFGKNGKQGNVDSMQTFGGEIPLYQGDGEILRIVPPSGHGERTFQKNVNGWIVDVTYKKAYTPLTVEQMGIPASEKTVVLSFDDGPDPDYTEEILDILKEHNVKASFFVTGLNTLRNPELVKRMVEEGHDVGNHSFTHADLGRVSESVARLEMIATQRLFQGLTGRTMTMVRPPYQAGVVPVSEWDWTVLKRTQQGGSVIVGERVDAKDWYFSKPEEIERQLLKELPKGHIVLLHDAGGDRSGTVKALPEIIRTLKQQGFVFAPPRELLGKSVDQVMPRVQPEEKVFAEVSATVFASLGIFRQAFSLFLGTALVMGFVRVTLLIYFAFRQRKNLWQRRRAQTFTVVRSNYNPLVSVVIAAYNEEKVINKTIRSVLASDYRPLEVIIVNDGSTDRTAEVIREEFAGTPGIRVITKPNSGKTDSINAGYRYAKGEIIVSIDADTIIAPDAITLMVRHFVDEKVAAVSGNVKVGNIRNLLTLWQHVEYITGFNLERRAFDELNSIPVVPGAIGAWRKSAVEEAGYYQHDTLAEDTDITLTLLRLGYKVQYEDRAYAWTEAPEDVRSFLKQRTRWIYGTLQCLWKHRGALFSGKQKTLGYITLPNMWLFQYGVQVLSPFVDLLSIIGFFTSSAQRAMLFYVVFLVFDLLTAFFAFSLEKESPKPLIWLFLQRFVYRQFMTYIVFKSLYLSLKGVLVGWNKLVRKGNVPAEAEIKTAG